MTYGMSPNMFVEDGPSAQIVKLDRQRSSARTWHGLGADGRWAMIERALSPANDFIDEFPVAL